MTDKSGNCTGEIHVIVDTTTLHDQAAEMDTVVWRAILTATKRGTIKLSIPLVVLKEAQRQVKAATVASLQNLRISSKKLRTIESRQQFEQFLTGFEKIANDDASNYLKRVTQRISDHGGKTLGLPNMTHDDFFERAVNFVQPFKQDGSGYRDALIWQSVVELAAGCSNDSKVYFVSHNSKDFGFENALAPHLVNDVSKANPSVHVELLPKLQDVLPILETISHRSDTQLPSSPAESIEDEAASNNEGLRFEDALRSELEKAINDTTDALLGSEVSVDNGPGLRIEMALGRRFQNATMVGVSLDFTTLETQIFEVLDGGDQILRCQVTSEAEFEGFVDKAEVYSLPEYVHVFNYDHNNHYSEVSVNRALDLVFDVIQSEGGYVLNCDFVEGLLN